MSRLFCRTLPLAAFFALGLAAPGQAQSITPAADGVGTVIHHNGNTYHIHGGTQAGANLFHSFQDFGLSPSEIANFLSHPAIQNVVGRVVGGNPSLIEGLIQVSGGQSNLYLMNPAGWIFTNGASLDVPGSFGVTTATRMGFAEGVFSVVETPNFATLTGHPTDLLFDSVQPGTILNGADLQVGQGSLWMVGGSIINTGTLTAPEGTITLAAVPGESRVRLSHDGMQLGLVLDALPVTTLAADAPLGLRPEDLPRYLTGRSDLGSATQVAVGPDGGLWLTGSEIRLEQGEVVIGGAVHAPTVQLMAVGPVRPVDPALVQGQTTVVRFPEPGGTNTLSVIDGRVDDAEALLYGGEAGTIARIIERHEDGIEVITTQLEAMDTPLDGIAITAEGHKGYFWLGRSWVNSETAHHYAQEFARWSEALTAQGDLLLYVCFTALGEVGEGFVATLAELTGLDVAASTNATGSANYGGDWTLEYHTGNIEVGTPFTAETLAEWEGRLALFTVGAEKTPTLADAITAANVDGSAPHTINFATGVTLINLTEALPVIDRELTITGEGTNVTIRRDAATDFRIFAVGTVATTFDFLTITGGSTTANGGGIFSDGAVTLTNSTVSGNEAGAFGGGIYGYGAVTLTDSTVSDNTAGSSGGGIYSYTGVTLTNSTVSGNTATTRYGGGIYSYNGVTLTNSTVSGNTAGLGGGGLSSYNAVTVTNSTVSGNEAGINGGGIYSGGELTLINSTLAFNTAGGIGGGVALGRDYTRTFTNSIITGNTAVTAGPNVGIIGVATPTFNISNSLIRDTAGMDANGSTGVPTNGVNGNIVGVDPLLAPLANNGGPTQTHALALTSPALNAGRNDLATGLTTDQRGAPGLRIVGGTVDMGAFEWQGTAITALADPPDRPVGMLANPLDVSVKVSEATFGVITVPGVSVRFRAEGAEGTFSGGQTVITNDQGIATNSFTATEASGNFSVQAQVADEGLSLDFNFTYTPPAPAPDPTPDPAPDPTPDPAPDPTPDGFDVLEIRQIWSNPLAETAPDGSARGRACATLPALEELEQTDLSPDERVERLAELGFDASCFPMSE